MEERARNARLAQDAIREVLASAWDPLGIRAFDLPPSEYDAYIGGIYGLLARGAPEREIAEHLASIERDEMGLTASDDARRLDAARKLRQLDTGVTSAPPIDTAADSRSSGERGGGWTRFGRSVAAVFGVVLAAALLSVGIAWTCAALAPLRSETAENLPGPDGFPRSSSTITGFGRTRYDWIGNIDPPPPPSSPLQFDWGADTPADRFLGSVEDSGWPFHCMRATVRGFALFIRVEHGRIQGAGARSGVAPNYKLRGVIPLADERLTGTLAKYSTWRGLGLQPLWLGLLGNICVYLGVVAIGVLLMRVARSLRAARRAKRGRCVRCAHPLAGGAVCPECGTPCAAWAAAMPRQRG